MFWGLQMDMTSIHRRLQMPIYVKIMANIKNEVMAGPDGSSCLIDIVKAPSLDLGKWKICSLMIKISIALWHWQVALLLFVVCEEGPAPHKYWINDESGLKGVKMRSQYFLKMVAYIKRIHNFPVIIPYPPKSLPWEEIRVVVIEIWIWRSVLILSLTSVVLEAVGGRVWFEELVWDWHPIPSQPVPD